MTGKGGTCEIKIYMVDDDDDVDDADDGDDAR